MNTARFILITVIALLFISGTTTAYAIDTARILFNSSTPTTKPGQIMIVNVVVDSNTPVNAVQVKILYPTEVFNLLSINYTNSQFSIQADQTTTPGSITLARGNIEPRNGKNLFATLVFKTKTNGNMSYFSYSLADSLAMSSTKNENILVNSQVATVKPNTNRGSGVAVQTTPFPNSKSKAPPAFYDYFLQEVKKSFQQLFK